MPNLKTGIHNPEALLNNFNKKLSKLLTSVKFLSNPLIENSIKELLKKTVTAEMLYKNYVISISGLQGVGKSTILKKVYGLPDNIIPENIERGEKTPIMFTEMEDIPKGEFRTLVWKLKDDFKDDGIIYKEEIEHEDFLKKSRSPSSDDLLLEIEVPANVFELSGCSFMLLPGLEDKKEDWQRLVKMSLIMSVTTVFVFNEVKFADGDNRRTLEMITEEFGEAKPVFCLSFSDQSKDKNETLKREVTNKYRITEQETDRVINTGTTDELLTKWIPQFIHSVNKYSRTPKSFRAKQLEFVDDLMLNDLGNVITEIEKLIISSDLSKKSEEGEYQKIIDVFDLSVEKLRKEYIKKLETVLNDFAIKPVDMLEDNIIEKRWLEKLKERILGKNLKEQKEFEKGVRDAWMSANNCSFEEVYPNVLSHVNSKLLHINGLNNNLLLPVNKDTKLIGKYDEEAIKENVITEDIQENYDVIYSISNSYKTDFNNKLEDSVKLIPVLASEFLRINAIIPNYSKKIIKLKENNTDDALVKSKIDEMLGNFMFMKDTQSKVIAATASIIGLDLLVDGQINTIPALLSALGINLTGSALVMLNIAAGAVGIGGLIGVAFHQVNKYELEQREYVFHSINLLKDNYYSHYLGIFDDFMEIVRDELESRLGRIYLVNRNYHRNENIKKNLNLLKEIRDVIREDISEMHNFYGF